MAAVGESGKKLLASYLEYHSRWEEEEKRRKGWMWWKRWIWKRRENGEREWGKVMIAALHAVSRSCSSQQPEGSRAQIWPANQKVDISIRLRFFFFFFASFSPQTRLHTRCFQPSQGVLLFEVKAVGCFYRRFEFHFTFSLMAVILIVRLLSLKNLLPVTWGSPPPPCSAFHMTEWSFTVDPY